MVDIDDIYGVTIKPHPTLALHKFSNVRKRDRRGQRSVKYDMLINLSSDSDDELNDVDSVADLESRSDATSDSDLYHEPMPVARGSDRAWINKSSTRRLRAGNVPCGIGARARLRRGMIPGLTPIDHSSSLETINTNEDDERLIGSRSRRRRSPIPLLRGLSMIEELSPILDPNDELSKMPKLQLARNWRPLQNSTATSSQQLLLLPKTNPRHHNVYTTPVSSHGTQYRHSVLSSNNRSETTSSLFDEESRKENRRPHLDHIQPLISHPSNTWKPDHYGLPAPFARRIGCKGKLQLSMSISGCRLTVSIIQAVFFLDPAQTQATSYVRVELRKNALYRKGDRCGLSDWDLRSNSSQSFRTRLVPLNNRPQFFENFTFELRRSNYRNHDLLNISVWTTNADNTARKCMLGCMAFPIRRLIRKANLMSECGGYDEKFQAVERTVINDGNFFLLRPELGERQNFPESKINVKKYYDDIGISSGGSSLTHSPPKFMRNSDWSHQAGGSLSASSGSQTVAGTSMQPGVTPGYNTKWTYGLQPYGVECSSSSDGRGPCIRSTHPAGLSQKISKNQAAMQAPINFHHNDLNYTTESSSLTSLNTFADGHYRPAAGLPSITTTSDGMSDLSSVDMAAQGISVDAKYLCPQQLKKFPKDLGAVAMRRTASFTFSPKASLEKVNQRITHQNEPKRKVSRFAKTLDYLKSKMDVASTSTLYPSRDEVRRWQESFEALLNHKYGCLLFRTFLKGEFSDENVDFWHECEDFRKLKFGKKSTIQKAHSIYNQYIAEQSPKEVNLDNDTRVATKAALEDGAKPNMFTLAQTRIEQLMAKDSYRRFLKSKLFTDLLNDGSGTSTASSDKTIKCDEQKR